MISVSMHSGLELTTILLNIMSVTQAVAFEVGLMHALRVLRVIELSRALI